MGEGTKGLVVVVAIKGGGRAAGRTVVAVAMAMAEGAKAMVGALCTQHIRGSR